MGNQQIQCTMVTQNCTSTNKQMYLNSTSITATPKQSYKHMNIQKNINIGYDKQLSTKTNENDENIGLKKCQFVYIKPIKIYQTFQKCTTNETHSYGNQNNQNQNDHSYQQKQKLEEETDKQIILDKQNTNNKRQSNKSNKSKDMKSSGVSIQQDIYEKNKKTHKLNKKFTKSIGNINYKEYQQNDKTNQGSLSLNQVENKGSIDRIFVQWSQFIKIKKKNYLQDYVYVKQIGVGAFGTVSKIKMKYGGLFRAAKTVKISALTQKKIKKQKFMAQIMIPMKTDHPNINKLFEVFEFNNQFVLIMQLCEGGDLFSYIKSQKTFGQNKIADIMKQILSGIVYLHKNNIIHRDLKPQNMLYDTQSKLLKIIDFGSAIQLSAGKKLTSIVGTPYYIAPQVLAGEYDEKCDIWSCGIILYILLSGMPPFTGKTQQQIMNNIRTQSISFTNPIWNKRSKQSKKLVLQMLNKDHYDRPTASDVLNSQWILNAANNYHNQQLGLETIKHLSNFHDLQFQNKLKAVVYTFIASQLYSNKDKQKLLTCFRQIDKDGDGVIQKQQILAVFKAHQQKNDIIIDIDGLIQKVDTNGSGQIDFTQFLVAASKEEQLLQKQRLENAFAYLDTDHSGYITADQIKPFLDSSDKTAEEIKQIFQQVDANGDGKISKHQFIQLLMMKKD